MVLIATLTICQIDNMYGNICRAIQKCSMSGQLLLTGTGKVCTSWVETHNVYVDYRCDNNTSTLLGMLPDNVFIIQGALHHSKTLHL